MLQNLQRQLGLIAGGEAGKRAAIASGIQISADTLLRRVVQAPEPTENRTQHVGIDEWAWHRGHKYGTLIVNLDTHRPLVLLPGREQRTLAAWFKKYPEIQVISRDRGGNRVINKSVFLALGINIEGQKELLGMWLAETEGAKFWLNVLTELKNRGLNDILIACIDGLKGFPDAINTVYPETRIQLCIVHMVRNSLRFVSWKDYKAVTRDLKAVYQAPTEEAALQALEAFSAAWDGRYPQISRSWESNWHNLATFFAYPTDIRKVIYTTNAIESLNSVIRHAIKKRKVFPTDDSVKKVVWLAIQSASQKWTMPLKDWRMAMSRFIIEFGDRLDGHF